jgi:hypothetical protein
MVPELNAAGAGSQSSKVVDCAGSGPCRGDARPGRVRARAAQSEARPRRATAVCPVRAGGVVPTAGSGTSVYPAADSGVILNRHTAEPPTADSRISTFTGLPSTSSQ